MKYEVYPLRYDAVTCYFFDLEFNHTDKEAIRLVIKMLIIKLHNYE